MKLITKRLIAILLSVFMMVEMLPISALAEGGEPSDVPAVTSSVSSSVSHTVSLHF